MLKLQNPAARRPAPTPFSPTGTGLPAGDNAQWDRLAAKFEGLILASKQQTAAAAALLPPRILLSRQDLIPAAGSITYSVSVRIAAVRVRNFAGGALTVVSGRGQASAPTIGVGVRTVPGGQSDLVPVGDSAVTVFGPVGALVAVDCYSKWPGLTGQSDVIIQSTELNGTSPQFVGYPGCAYFGYSLQLTNNGSVLNIEDEVSAVQLDYYQETTATPVGGATVVYPKGVTAPGGIKVFNAGGMAGAIRWA